MITGTRQPDSPGRSTLAWAAELGRRLSRRQRLTRRLQFERTYAQQRRFVGSSSYSDFTANLMNPKQEQAWFSALNPRLGLMVAYVWRRADFPWLGIWEENRDRKTPPWHGKSLTRGMEFSNSPFPVGLRKAVDRGRFQGQPTYRWLAAQGKIAYDYAILACPVEASCKGVATITPAGKTFGVDLVV